MELNPLTAISPIDGRYRRTTGVLARYFSEAALIRYRIITEVEYFIALCELPLPQLADFDKKQYHELRKLYTEFDLEAALRIKEIENVTNHDVKAVEYLIKEKFDALGLQDSKEFIHFGLTSQDINNTAIPNSIKDAVIQVCLPTLEKVLAKLLSLAQQWKEVPMLARTHGQPASPTRLGKEVYVFAERLQKQIDQLKSIPFSAKFGGATGNFNAHFVAYPEYDWITFGNHLVNDVLGLNRSQTTTQIEHYDNLASLFDAFRRINTIFVDLNRDFWTYVSMNYFKQKIREGEIGSSAMPHKVNPIDFENSEGNLGMANAIFGHLSEKLPVSRMQRDLTDSTVLRNVGVPLGHSVLGYDSLLKGLNKLELCEDACMNDLKANWAVVGEAIQTILRREGYPNPYETLKALTRTHHQVDQELISTFIDGLEVNDTIKAELKAITPWNYTGVVLH